MSTYLLQLPDEGMQLDRLIVLERYSKLLRMALESTRDVCMGWIYDSLVFNVDERLNFMIRAVEKEIR